MNLGLVFLSVVDQRNRLLGLLDAVDRHAEPAAGNRRRQPLGWTQDAPNNHPKATAVSQFRLRGMVNPDVS